MEIRTLNPAEADVRFHVAVDRHDDRLSVKGRLVGPRCAYASTVEVAYPFRDALPGEPNRLSTRAIIPEPNLWEPACPFLYEATLELFEDGSRIDVSTMTVGLRSVAVSGTSFVLNGKRFRPKTKAMAHPTETDLAQARKQFNTVVLPVSEDASPLWHACDQVGMGVLGRVESQATPERFANHPCLLAWIVHDKKTLAAYRANPLRPHVPIGLQIRSDTASTSAPDADFVIVAASWGQHFEKWGMPVIELM
jgi:hypothetical protein